ncbi:BTB/POZ domain-containing protein 3-like isoform X2 [Zootermopsis nevadensis]|uniref:BTB/POZ domain-containing protein 3-like isoform X2 n=1 Tax=Zootermopsis nevadensis TaxID=136037 RepID=UPI000B8E86D5|nr:BTB/POZ domain-containing protein 3-like isoform X2 [Zootermopsis nevadensis]
MCPNDNGACTKPLLPRSEAGSDVIFLVGPEQWRFPGHRAVLAAANPVFQAMLNGPMASRDTTTIPIEDVDGRAFENLLRYLYKEAVQLQSVPTALHTLYAAFKYQCGGLVKICVLYLDSQLDSSSVLEVYSHLRIYYDPTVSSHRNIQDNSSSAGPSAPPMEATACGSHIPSVSVEGYQFLPAGSEDITDAMSYCGALQHNCLYYIDMHTKEVLEQEQLEDLDLDGLRLIAERETLTVPLESILFDALVRWCNRECKRRRLELSAENKRAVLGEETLYAVRYLLMSSEEFLAGPMQSGLLNQREINMILGHILHHPVPENPCLSNVIPRMRTPRNRARGQPIPLSQRSNLECSDLNIAISQGNGSQSGNTRRWVGKGYGKKDAKKQKKQKSKSCSPERGNLEGHKQSTGSCIAQCVFSALSCVFD